MDVAESMESGGDDSIVDLPHQQAMVVEEIEAAMAHLAVVGDSPGEAWSGRGRQRRSRRRPARAGGRGPLCAVLHRGPSVTVIHEQVPFSGQLGAWKQLQICSWVFSQNCMVTASDGLGTG